MELRSPNEFFAGNMVGRQAYDRVLALLQSAFPDVNVRVGKSQVAFRRERGFAFLWVPGQYLSHPTAPVVLSIASANRLSSPRFKEVVHPGPWMHHLELQSADEVDAEVTTWLLAAAAEAGS